MVTADGEFSVALDDRPVRTPAKAMLRLPTRALAEAVAEEWQAQGEKIAPQSMAMMTLAATAIDRVMGRRTEVVDEIAAYAGSDLLCHRAEEPPELVERQTAEWQPLLDWGLSEVGAKLDVTSGVMPVRQQAPVLAAYRAAVDKFTDMALAGLHLATATSGSLVIALALAAGRLDAEAAWAVSQLDETFQIERWGLDAEAEQRRETLRADIRSAERFLALLKA